MKNMSIEFMPNREAEINFDNKTGAVASLAGYSSEASFIASHFDMYATINVVNGLHAGSFVCDNVPCYTQDYYDNL